MTQGTCNYPARKQNNTKTLREVSESLAKSRHVLQELFPSVSLDSLSTMDRQGLLQLIQSSKSPITENPRKTMQDEDIQCLEPAPQQEFEWDESRKGQEVSDDLNGLALTPHRSSSYLGISSINALLKVIASISPGFSSWIQRKSVHEQDPNPIAASEKGTSLPNEQSSIDAFFTHIHYITPIINETDFRTKYSRGKGNESSWKALLNMVLTLGSIVTPSPDEKSHAIFYTRAQENLGMESFGSGNLETVQALGLLGGYYCHYLNQPNMANVILGAALRMAITMGLHREDAVVDTEPLGSKYQVLRETRRRVWWSLFCLDTWGSMLLGRPVLGRWDPETITARLPSELCSPVCFLEPPGDFGLIET